jgi:hypothetical protein
MYADTAPVRSYRIFLPTYMAGLILPSSVWHYCGSGSGIGCLFDPWIRDGRKSASGSGIRDEQPGSYFLELRNHFFAFLGVKILKFFDEDPGSGMETVRIRDPGWKKVGSGIRDKHPGSDTLVFRTGEMCAGVIKDRRKCVLVCARQEEMGATIVCN